MLIRNSLLSVFGIGVATYLVLPATSAELPKEGTCHLKVEVEGKKDFDRSSSVGPNGITGWDETHTLTGDCGQTQWPSMNEHCFGFDKLIGDFAFTNGYCLGTDEDGDKLLWKFGPLKYKQISSVITGALSEVLLSSGKYKGISAKSTSDCSYSGSLTQWSGHCDVDMTFKFP
jgi:hypothetical protein